MMCIILFTIARCYCAHFYNREDGAFMVLCHSVKITQCWVAELGRDPR